MAQVVQVKLSWVDIQKGEIRQPLLTTPIAFGRTLTSMPEQLHGQRVSRMVLGEAQVDPYHALLEVHDGQLRVNDRGSRSGTPVNDVTLPYQQVKKGDRIQIGPYTIHVTEISAAAASPPPPPPRPAPPPQTGRPNATSRQSTAQSSSPRLSSPQSSSSQPSAPRPQPTESPLAGNMGNVEFPASAQPMAGIPLTNPGTAEPLVSQFNQSSSGTGYGTDQNSSEQFGVDGTCNRQIGFLFKRRCGRTSTAGCTHCKNGRVNDDPFFYDYDTYYPGYGSYRRGYWGHSYYRDRDRYYYDANRRSTDFTEADGESFEHEGDQDYEMDLDAS